MTIKLPNRSYLISLGYLLATIMCFVSQEYRILVWYLTISSMLTIIDKLGKGIVLRETIAFLYIFSCLFIPLLGFDVYNIHNSYSYLWRSYMKVPFDTYFSYAIPAVSLFCFALTYPVSDKGILDEDTKLTQLLNICRSRLANKKTLGLKVMALGIFINLVIKVLPSELQYVATILFFSSFAGMLYVYLTPDLKYKWAYLTGFILLIVINAISIGMFTIVAYMSITLFSFFFLGKRTSLIKKLSVVVIAILFLVVLQNTKLAYRAYVWQKVYEGNQVALFADLFWKNAKRVDQFWDDRSFFPIYVRANQGLNVSMVMARIPTIKPIDNGEHLFTTIFSSFVPRFLWPDKPLAGGRYNMLYYTGQTIRVYSTNIGPLGEAYGSFGVGGGILFMFLLGVFIRWGFKRFIMLAYKIPMLICWLPVLFFENTYSAETDTLQVMNSLLKIAFLLWMIYLIFPGTFGVEKTIKRRRARKVFEHA